MKLTFKQWKQIELMLYRDYIEKNDEYQRERERLLDGGANEWEADADPCVKALYESKREACELWQAVLNQEF